MTELSFHWIKPLAFRAAIGGWINTCVPATCRWLRNWTGSRNLLKADRQLLDWATSTARADPDLIRYSARTSVWSRWLVWLVTAFCFSYRSVSRAERKCTVMTEQIWTIRGKQIQCVGNRRTVKPRVMN